MSKTIIITEKPSVAQDFAKALTASKKGDGYLENDRYIITWAYGHLCELKEPEEYNSELKQWTLDTLPIFPERFQYKVLQSAKKQFQVIKSLLNRSDVSSVVIATDCGREGELIARLILQLAGNKKPVYRLWTSEALTEQVIRKQMQQLKPASEFDRLYQSALARQWADWLVGINCTRAVTCKNRELFTVGRVQTAVLALVVQREREIRNFKPQPYYNVSATFKRRDDVFKGIYFKPIQNNDDKETEEENDTEGITSKYAIAKKIDADRIVSEVKGKTGIIKEVTSKISSEKPPLLFFLTTLQQECNRLFGFSADKTLAIAQSLYEKHRILSYPRTESQHLDPQYAEECKKILSQIRSVIKFDINKCSIDKNNKRVFDLSKLTDHHALIPQGAPTQPLTEDERKVFELVCKRFVSAFYPDCKFKNTTIYIQVNQHNFLAKGKTLVDAGWREIYGGLKSDIILPHLAKGEKVFVADTQTVEKQTQPPPRYTDATLLEIMANAHKVVQNEELKKILKENAGIGTPATRAQIIKNLQDRKYLIRQGKAFVPTTKAEFLIDLLKDEKVASPEYTAIWEQELERIAKGEVKTTTSFLESIKNYVSAFVGKIKNSHTIYDKQTSFNTKKKTFSELNKVRFKPQYSKTKVYKKRKTYPPKERR
ncbi:MAG: DNA topoisomerase 3 [Candidatus Methanofastidiosum sp.]|nr:DNA topoisomerase 3 [Methanofastidiosum sp.]